jgi:3-hydroxyisobutyrate dehydrogenase-like beta-hydroxyacid dehydrogenase
MSIDIGFIGLFNQFILLDCNLLTDIMAGIGNMGFQMAGNVRKKMAETATLHIFDVNHAACHRFVDKFGGFGPIKIARSSKEVAYKSVTVISMLPMDQHARAVYLDKEAGVIAAPSNPNRLILECSTIGITTTQEIGEQIQTAGLGTYVDTPVSGGVGGAEAGTLSFFCGHSGVKDSVVKRIRYAISWMGASERIHFCGHLGAGLASKIVNNYIGLSNIAVAAQGMAFGLRHGIDKEILYKCIKGSSGDSWVMDFAQPVPGILAKCASSNGFRAGFTPRLCVKDISMGIKAAKQVGIDATMGEIALKIFEKADQDLRTTVSLPLHACKVLVMVAKMFLACLRISTARLFGSISMTKLKLLLDQNRIFI